MSEIPRLEDLEGRLDGLSGRRILVRTDFNVPLDDSSGAAVITDDFRIRSALPTIEWLTERGAHVVLDIDVQGARQIRQSVPEAVLIFLEPPDWEELERKLVRLPSMNKVARRIVRIMVGYATEVDMDANGRILVSRELRDFASLEKNAILIGQGNKFELWDEATWNDKRDAWLSEEDDGELPAELESIAF